MKLLKKVLLIHWHYFDIEEIEFDKLNFLTGKNASGKSTLIDAMQLVLLGDTSGRFFNKSASGRTNRTLTGYLMGELGDDEASGFRYLRNGRFTSYIALEFYDEEKKREFTAGICFDIYSESDISRSFFLYDGPLHPDRFLNEKQVPLDLRALKAWLKAHYAGHYKATDSNKDFRSEFYGKLGGLRERFGTLLKKAVSFNPDVDLQKFITEFVCDIQQPVDITHMQENIRSYKILEAESEILGKRTDLLGTIIKTSEEYEGYRKSEQVYDYLIRRSDQSVKEEELIQAESALANLTDKLTALTDEEGALAEKLEQLGRERDDLMLQKNTDNAALAIQKIDAEITGIESIKREAETSYESTVQKLAMGFRNWEKVMADLVKTMEHAELSHFEPVIQSPLKDLQVMSQKTLTQLEPVFARKVHDYGTLEEETCYGLSESVRLLRGQAQRMATRLSDLQSGSEDRKKEKEEELANLKKGIFPYPRDVVDLQEAIRSRLLVETGKEIPVRIAAETADIRDERWRNAIEGYLNTQKYYLLISADYFALAVRIYDEIKTTRKIYSRGIVDLEKLISQRREPLAGSLAREIRAEDDLAQAFFDNILGQVVKCESVGELRQHRTSLTAEGMQYSNFVVRAMDPKLWAKPAIGQGAHQRMVETLEKEVAELDILIKECTTLLRSLNQAAELESVNPGEWSRFFETFASWRRIPELELEIRKRKETRLSIDTSRLDGIIARITEVEAEKQSGESTRLRLNQEIGQAVTKITSLKEEQIPTLKEELEEKLRELEIGFSAEWVEETGGPRFEKELTGRGSAQSILNAFPREKSRATNALNNTWKELVEQRRSYNDIFKMGYDINSLDHSIYEDAWLELIENRLPDFTSRITDAKAKAFEQFQEDFLSRLQNNINNARRQIDELNQALKGASFGEDIYRFKMLPRVEYKRFYDMIVDDMLVRGYSLLSESFNAKYKDEISDLFSLITQSDDNGRESQETEKRIQEFTDYRTYLTFDLEVESPDGTTQRLSKTLGKKSGGETQTPFYIAVLASFAQLYRTGRDQTMTTARLIIFDEAFSKMDGERIIRSMELLRRFNFQVILSAPPDKVADIATLVDRNLCVYRKGSRTAVQSFSPREQEIVYEY